jgi:hypothetical protein
VLAAYARLGLFQRQSEIPPEECSGIQNPLLILCLSYCALSIFNRNPDFVLLTFLLKIFLFLRTTFAFNFNHKGRMFFCFYGM